MEKITKVRRVGSDIIVEFKDKQEPVCFDRVCGGLTWPSAVSPGYFGIFGQAKQMNKMKKPIRLLYEFSSDRLGELLGQLRENARDLLCWEFYTEPYAAKDKDFYVAFNESAKRQDLSRAKLLHPEITNWLSGLSIIREWAEAGSLVVSMGSILAKELGSMTREDQQDSRRPFFPAASSACNLIGSFVKPIVRFPETSSNDNYFYG